MTMHQCRADVAVLGAGLAGLRAATVAQECGARVLLLEKQPGIGGSSALSAGMYWTAPDLAGYRQRIPLGDIALATRVIDQYEASLADIRATGVAVDTEPTLGVMGFGRGYTFDVRGYLDLLSTTFVADGGTLLLAAYDTTITRSPADGRLMVSFEKDRERVTVSAAAVVLATGGFQAGADLRATLMSDVRADIVLRSNPGSTGDGLRLARALGGGLAGDLSSFYGHLIPRPIRSFHPEQFMLFSQYYSNHCVLLDEHGRRFSDETQGDEIVNQDLAKHNGRSFLIFDDRVRSTYGVAEPFRNFGVVDRYRYAVEAGANHACADDLDELAAQLGALGVNHERARATLRAAAAASGEELGAIQLTQRPYYALEVQASITFTLGGIAVRPADALVLTTSGEPVPGVYSAGADIGGLSNYGYAGGLAPAHILGGIAGAAAAAHGRSG